MKNGRAELHSAQMCHLNDNSLSARCHHMNVHTGVGSLGMEHISVCVC